MKRWLASLLVVVALRSAVAGSIHLPVYIEDNHAGSFYWLAEQLDLGEPHTLLHFDAHSDASGIFDSDALRERMRRVPSRMERARVLERWRTRGAVQCFSWIEPFMPAPIAEVIWIPPDELLAREGRNLADTAGDLLDGHLEAAARAAGPLRARFRVMSLAEARTHSFSAGPIIASIDLDSFAELPAEECARAFENVWAFISELRDLRAITIAISRPYLRDDAEADALVQLALRAALSLPTAQIQFEPFRKVGNDRSARADEYRAQGREVPAFDLTCASPDLRALLLANASRIAVREENTRWAALLQRWRDDAPTFRVSVKNHQPSTDKIWRVPMAEAAEIELSAEPWFAEFESVRWIVEVPRYLRCNLTATNGVDDAFAQGAPPRPRWRDEVLPETNRKISLATLGPFFDTATGWGSVRLRARVESANWVRETPTIEIRRFAGTGFRAALTEQFGLPYLFGAGALREGTDSGPETGWGADCANFLIHALRRQGRRIPWSNPKQFRQYLEAIPENEARFTEEELERGVILHLGAHVAALMEDRPPLGEVNADDIVAHQLEGVPALISVSDLLRMRRRTRFDLLRVPSAAATSDLVIGGDVMLARSIGEQITAGLDPFTGIRSVLERAGTTLVNLECVVAEGGTPARGRKYHLRAPVAAISTLGAAGIDLVSITNNHADDFGPAARREAARRLRAAGLTVLDKGDAPVLRERVAVLALNDLEPWDRARVANEIAEAKAKTEFVVAFVHWGEENTTVVTARQRELARWLIDHGVDVIAGSHPHCVQALDFYRGRAIAYSLGNLVFDGAPRLSSWNTGSLLEIGFPKRGGSPSLRLTPVKLDAQGLPHLAPSLVDRLEVTGN